MFTEDLTPLFDETYGFAVPATIGTATISVLFDNEYYGANGQEVTVATSKPVATCKTSDVAEVARGETIAIEGIDYTVVDKQPDGRGVTLLILEEA